MKVFLDANILVSVINKEYPLFSLSARILSLTENKNFEIYTSGICLAIAFYFAEKRNKKTAAEKIKLICSHLSIAPITESTVNQTIRNVKVKDFEDGLEYYSALEAKCDCIITENGKDFYFSDIEVLDSKTFCEKYLI